MTVIYNNLKENDAKKSIMIYSIKVDLFNNSQ
jgi:hypothetical protein